MSTRSEELLDEVAAYADRLADSDNLADTGSMATAEALAELYEKREWVEEWLEQKPIRERAAYIGGRPPEPDSRNRFAQWLVWKEDQRQRRALRSAQTYRLLTANEVRGYLSSGEITSEFTLRPLYWLRKNRTPERIPEVWKRAIGSALGADHSTVVRDLATGADAPVDESQTVTSLDGRQRPATQPRREPEVIDAETVEPDPLPQLSPDLRARFEREDQERKRESELRAARSNLRSALIYLTSTVLEPTQLAADYTEVLADFEQDDLDFAADTMAAIAALKRGES